MHYSAGWSQTGDDANAGVADGDQRDHVGQIWIHRRPVFFGDERMIFRRAIGVKIIGFKPK